MAAFTRFHCFTRDLGLARHDFSYDVLKLALTNVAPSQANDDEFADLTEIASGNGYSSGGATLTTISWTMAAGITRLFLADKTITASGGSIGPFRYAVIYNTMSFGVSSPRYPLIGYIDRGSPVTLGNGDSYTFDFDGSSGGLALV